MEQEPSDKDAQRVFHLLLVLTAISLAVGYTMGWIVHMMVTK